MHELITIVKPSTFLKWIRESKRTCIKKDRSRRPKPRRPQRTPEDIRALILKMARETNWGMTRITGELHKLRLNVSRTTVRRILKEAGIPTGPVRSHGTWSEFLKRHVDTLWACDFASHKVLTKRGFKEAFVLVFMHVASRRTIISSPTLTPSHGWMIEQAELFSQAVGTKNSQPASEANKPILLHDRDSKFTDAFKQTLRQSGIKPQMLPIMTPNLNAHVERFIKTLQTECLDRFIVLGLEHLGFLTSEFEKHYNVERPHSGIAFRTPTGPPRLRLTDTSPSHDRVRCKQRLGGVLRHYYRSAA